MTKEEITKLERIRDEVRKVINQIFDEEYEAVIQQIMEGNGKLTDKSVEEIVANLLKIKD